MDLIETDSSTLNRHPWETARADSILSISSRGPDLQYADIGAGDLYFCARLKEQSERPVYAADIYFKDGLNHPGIITEKDHKALPKHSVDEMFLLDVLEHVEEEIPFLLELKELLKPTGRIIVTVPAHAFLFSEHDVFLKHFRRYDKTSLTQVLTQAGLEVDRCFYFYSSLFLVRILQNAIAQKSKKDLFSKQVSRWQYSESHPVSKFFRFLLTTEFRASRWADRLGISLPGLSLCAVIRATNP